MKKIMSLVAIIFGIMIIPITTNAEYLRASYFSTFNLMKNGADFKGNEVSTLADGKCGNANCVFFNDEMPYDNKYFEAFLIKPAEVSSIEIWAYSGNTWNYDNQRITKVRIDYYDDNVGEWKTASDEYELDYSKDEADASISKAVYEFDAPVKTHKLRVYIIDRVGYEASKVLRLDELKINGQLTAEKFNNSNLLYNAQISSTDNYYGVIQGIADGCFNEGSDHSNSGDDHRIGTTENPYEIIFDFGDDYYSVSGFEYISQYALQAINQFKLQYNMCGRWIDINTYNYDLSKNDPMIFGVLLNPVDIKEEFSNNIISNKFKMVITGCAATNLFRISELILNGSKAQEFEIPKIINDSLTADKTGEYTIFSSKSPFVVKVLEIKNIQNGTLEIGYFDNDSFACLDTINLDESDFKVVDYQPLQNIAFRLLSNDEIKGDEICIYALEPFAYLSDEIKQFMINWKYEDYKNIKEEINEIEDESVASFYNDKLKAALDIIIEKQVIDVKDFNAKDRKITIFGQAFAEDDSYVKVTIKDTENHVQIEDVKVQNGIFEKTIELHSTKNGTFSADVEAFWKHLHTEFTTRDAYANGKIMSFTIDGVNGVITGNSIKLELPVGDTLKGRIAEFSATEMAKLYIGETELISGETAVDYPTSATIKVIAEDENEFFYNLKISIKSYSGGSGGGGSTGSTSKTLSSGIIAIPQEIETTDFEFTDVEKKYWAYNYIMKLHNKGVVEGVDQYNFAPNKNVKREEFAKMLVLCLNLGTDGEFDDFDDTSKHWSRKYVSALNKAGYIFGVSDKNFGVGKDITREDVCAILYRCIGDGGENNITEPFEDCNDISDYAYDAVIFMQEKGYISGYQGLFNPTSFITRAEVSKILALIFYE